MKGKIKGLGGIKGMLLLHGEKLLIGAVAAASAALVYLALNAERLPDKYEHEKLTSQVNTTRANISSSENIFSKVAREHPEEVRIADATNVVVNRNTDVRPDYEHGQVNPRVRKNFNLRTDPVRLTAASPMGKSGAGLFGFIDAETRRQQDLRRVREDAIRDKAAALKLEQETGEGKGGRRSTGKNRTRDTDTRSTTVDDPEHPGRRSADGVANRGGVQLEGGELLELAHWVAVVAKVPVREQHKQYREAFEDKDSGGGYYYAELDFPEYKGYLVERGAEVIGGQQLPWQPVDVYDAKGTPARTKITAAMSKQAVDVLLNNAATLWAPGDGEVVSTDYLDPAGVLAYPLPPLVGRNWGENATHPDIPLASNSPDSSLVGETESVSQPAMPAQPTTTDIFSDPQGTDLGTSRDGRSGRPSFDGGRGGGFRGGGFRGSFGRGGGRGDAPMEREPSRGSGERGSASGNARAMLAPGVNSWLLRFYDFTVVPGKKYKYRVKLVLSDPNLASHVKYTELASTVIERIKTLRKGPDNKPVPAARYVYSDWSEPTPTVGVPLDGSVRVAAVQPGEDPRATLLVEAFGKDPKEQNWIQASPQNWEKDHPMTRGSVVNFVSDGEYLVENGAYIDKVDSFRFNTGITVLDMRGGERIGGRDMTAPARVLLMDPTGEMTLRRELDDAAEVQQHRDTFTKKKGGERDAPAPEPSRTRNR